MSGSRVHRAQRILWCVLLAFPVVHLAASRAVPPAPTRPADQTRSDFGVPETLHVLLPDGAADDPLVESLVESLAGRIERVDGVAECWSADRLVRVMVENGVEESRARERLRGFVVGSNDAEAIGLHVALADEPRDRAATIEAIRAQADYCGFEDVRIAGLPVLAVEASNAGASRHLVTYLLPALFLGLLGARWYTGRWATAAGVVLAGMFAVQATIAVAAVTVGATSLLTSPVPLVVLAVVVASAVASVDAHRSSRSVDGAVGSFPLALRRSRRALLVGAVATVAGLTVLGMTSAGPLAGIAFVVAIGVGVAVLVGVVVVPAFLVIAPPTKAVWSRTIRESWSVAPRWTVAAVTLIVLGTAFGIPRISLHEERRTRIPVGETAPIRTVEAVVDFGGTDTSVAERIAEVRGIERRLRERSGVAHTMSAATFLPDDVSQVEVTEVTEVARRASVAGSFVRADLRRWRISMRISDDSSAALRELRSATADAVAPVTFGVPDSWVGTSSTRTFAALLVGLPLLFGVIVGVLVIVRRSIPFGLIAGIGAFAPIAVTAGGHGWLGPSIGLVDSGALLAAVTFGTLASCLVTMRRGDDTSRRAVLGATLFAVLGGLSLVIGPVGDVGFAVASAFASAAIVPLVLVPAVLALREAGNVQERRLERMTARRPHVLDRKNRDRSSAKAGGRRRR